MVTCGYHQGTRHPLFASNPVARTMGRDQAIQRHSSNPNPPLVRKPLPLP